ncbi:reverse transcriptase domain-containing protein [Tanacetum coccineum]
MEGRINIPRIQALESEETTNKGIEESRGQTNKVGEPDGTILPPPIPSKKDTPTDEKYKVKHETLRSRSKVNLLRRSRLMEILRKYADAFTWTMTDMTGIPHFIAEHELKTYPHIEPRVQRKRSISLDRRKVIKDEVAEWLKAGIVRKNVVATYQRLVDVIFEGQMGRNLEEYVDDIVIKIKTAPEMIKDVKETPLTLKKTTKAKEAFHAMKKLIAELPTLTAPKKEEELMVYLPAANETVRAILLVEREGRQAPIHYVSRTLQSVEINYPPMEKLALALVHAARRLRRYFQGHTIKVIIDKPISQILNNQEATERLAEWGVKLEAYGIKYAPKSVIKGQVLADFLADIMTKDNPTHEDTNGPDDTLEEEGGREEQETTATKAPKNLKAEAEVWKLTPMEHLTSMDPGQVLS